MLSQLSSLLSKLDESSDNKIDLLNYLKKIPSAIYTEYPNTNGVLFSILCHVDFKGTENDDILLLALDNAPNNSLVGKNRQGKNLLHESICIGCSHTIVNLLVDRCPDSIHINHDKGGNTILHAAAKRGDRTILQMLFTRFSNEAMRLCACKRNKGGRTPLFESLCTPNQSIACIYGLLQLSDTATIWETKDKTGRLPIERVVNGSPILYGAFLNRLTNYPVQFYRDNMSILQHIIRDQKTISTSNVISLLSALMMHQSEIILYILHDQKSVDGICDDIFTEIIQNSQYPSIAFKLLATLATSELQPIMVKKRNLWQHTIFHIAAISFNDLITCIRMIAPTGYGVYECLTIPSTQGTPFHVAIREGSNYDFENRIETLRQECIEQFSDPDDVISRSLLVKDAHGCYAFEYTKTAKTLEILYTYIKPNIVLLQTAALNAAINVQSYPVFMDIINTSNINIVKNDALLNKVSRKKENIINIRPRRVLEYIIEHIHPSKVTESTMSNLINIATNLVSSRRDADCQLITCVKNLRTKWTIWQKWAKVKKYIMKRWIVLYWEEVTLNIIYKPQGEYMINSYNKLVEEGLLST